MLLYRVFTRSSKRPALHLLEICWTFAGSCKHPDILSGLHCLRSQFHLSGCLGGKLMAVIIPSVYPHYFSLVGRLLSTFTFFWLTPRSKQSAGFHVFLHSPRMACDKLRHVCGDQRSETSGDVDENCARTLLLMVWRHRFLYSASQVRAEYTK